MIAFSIKETQSFILYAKHCCSCKVLYFDLCLTEASQAFDDLDAEGTGTIPNTKSTLMQGVQLTGQNPTSQDLDTCMSSGMYYLTFRLL